ncbi:MAG: hypothetical protein RBR71_01285 [Gudongella sp.]|nr:hypothetical protein [Gudongella sp.]
MEDTNKRKELIKKIEKKNQSKVICYVTNDSPMFNGSIAADIYPLLFEVLEKIGKTNQIDVFLFSHGGDTLVPWKFVNLIREYADTFNVLIPFHANSAATLIALGANSIYMSRLGNIGPIDPTLVTPFNPPANKANPDIKNNTLGLSVEDVIGYYELSKNIMNLKSEASVLKTFEMLSQNVNPIALGSIYRSHNQIRSLARKLLEMHLDPEKDIVLINNIIENLTEKLYNHKHLIVRQEAKKILSDKLIKYPDEELENLILDLYQDIKVEMKLHDAKGLEAYIDETKPVNTIDGIVALIESYDIKYSFESKKIITKNPQNPQNGQINYNVKDKTIGWVKS